MIAFMGNEPEKPLALQGRKGAYEIKTTSEVRCTHSRVEVLFISYWLLADNPTSFERAARAY